MLPGDDQEPSRRAFLELAGFGVSAAALSSCSPGPRTNLIPGLEASSDYVAGKSYWVASTCAACSARCGLLAKCRDGRPIKLEGNPSDERTGGGLCATGQADLLSLYDSKRLRTPLKGQESCSWSEATASMVARLAEARAEGRQVRILTSTESSPSTRAAIQRFLSENSNAAHVTYDALSCSAMLSAHAELFGVRKMPSLRLDRAKLIVSFAADFLGTWFAPVEHAKDYARGRRPDEGLMSTHIQLEGALSMTGSVADRRVGLTASETLPVLAALCALLAQRAGNERAGRSEPIAPAHAALVEELAASLWSSRGESLVLSGHNDLHVQRHVAQANQLLGNYGRTLSLAQPSLQRLGDDGALWKLKGELESGSVDLLLLSGVNPAYDLPPALGEALQQASMLVQHTAQADESAALADYVLPAAHGLESWGDAEPVEGHYRLQQPLIPSFRESRTLRQVLASWVGDERGDRELLEAHWREQLHPRLAGSTGFDDFFRQALHDGVVTSPATPGAEPALVGDGLGQTPARQPAEPSLELLLYPKLGILDGRHAHNPWLQELPNPVTKVTWDNYACIAPELALELGLELGDVVRIQLDDASLELPVLVQRGQHPGVVAVALGYGRLGTDRFANVGPRWLEGRPTVAPGQLVGTNAAVLLGLDEQGLHYTRQDIQLEPTGRHRALACTQEHHSLEVPAHLAPHGAERRKAVLSASLADYSADPKQAIHSAKHATDAELWPSDHEPVHHHWGMAVDLSACNGCSACVVSCQAENNVPVVGKDEVLRHREMHWMRIDRYFEGDGGEVTAAHQPMFCQQCDHAPCESVCPVLATVHSSEGLNQQVYNRCVGTRYCANTCPYKVRRFNWFDYPREDQLQNHSLNPDVTIRTRGVMEKCSFCAQRIQEARSEAQRRGEPLADGDIQVACQQSCPTQAIVFGDLKDPESELCRLVQRDRSYRVLEELNVKPSVRYLARIRNTSGEEKHHG